MESPSKGDKRTKRRPFKRDRRVFLLERKNRDGDCESPRNRGRFINTERVRGKHIGETERAGKSL